MAEQNGIKLEPRDQQVLGLLAQGCSNKKIASSLNISPKSLKQHMRTLFLKLLVATRTTSVPGLNLERRETETQQPAAAHEQKAIGYGLPCSRCHAYYPADMSVCPLCKSPERVPPDAMPALSVVRAVTTPEPSVA
jgi:DNA-binding CsgD family transcriptional regulator